MSGKSLVQTINPFPIRVSGDAYAETLAAHSKRTPLTFLSSLGVICYRIDNRWVEYQHLPLVFDTNVINELPRTTLRELKCDA